MLSPLPLSTVTPAVTPTDPTMDRRKQPKLRAVFPAAYEALRPFFDPQNHWGSHSHDHLAYRTLKEHFPDLSAQDSFLIVITAKRLFSSGRAHVHK